MSKSNTRKRPVELDDNLIALLDMLVEFKIKSATDEVMTEDHGNDQYMYAFIDRHKHLITDEKTKAWLVKKGF